MKRHAFNPLEGEYGGDDIGRYVITAMQRQVIETRIIVRLPTQFKYVVNFLVSSCFYNPTAFIS